jgi:hypothetical protein
MEDTVYILIEQHRYIIPRRFSIIAIFDNPEAAMKEYDRYSRYIPCNDYAYEIKVEEWKLKK